MTDVVMPDECQSMPITEPRAWNQNGSLSRASQPARPWWWMTVSAMAVPSVTMRSASQAGTRPPCNGKSATPERFTGPLCQTR